MKLTLRFCRKSSIIIVSGCSTVGSARLLGSRGRRFKSCHPDHFIMVVLPGCGAVGSAQRSGR